VGACDLLQHLEAQGFRLSADGDKVIVRPAGRLTDDIRNAIRCERTAILAALAKRQGTEAAWADAEVTSLSERKSRLMRWGWSEFDAEVLAARPVSRARDIDQLVRCIDCMHYRPGRCSNFRRADLSGDEVGRELASLPQRCTGFQLLEQ